MSDSLTALPETTHVAAGSHEKRVSRLNFFASTIICWSILLGAFLVDQTLPPEQTGTVIAVFPPATTAAEISVAVVAANGESVSPTRYAKALVVHSAEAGFVGRLRSAGAVTVIKPLGPIGTALLGNRAVDFD